MTVMTPSKLIEPYGGQLVNLLAPPEKCQELTQYANNLPSIRISDRSVCDLELLAVGAFSPLDQFMGQADHQRVLDEMRLTDGHIFPLPITLPVDEDARNFLGQEIALRDPGNELLAIMQVEEMYPWDLEEVALKAFGSTDLRHPLVAEMHRWGRFNISGPIQMINHPRHYDFAGLRLTPAETRERLEQNGHSNVVAFQTRNPLHRVHEELTKRATQEIDGVLLVSQTRALNRKSVEVRAPTGQISTTFIEYGSSNVSPGAVIGWFLTPRCMIDS